jgi:O-antigen ligase
VPALQGFRRDSVFRWSVVICGLVAVAIALLRLPPKLFVIAPLLVASGLLLLRWPWLSGLLLVLSVPVQQVGALGAGALTMTRASLAVALGAVAIWWTVVGEPVVMHRGTLLFAVLLVVMLVTAQVADDQAASADELVRWGIAFLAFVAFVQLFSAAGSSRIVWFAAAVVGATALESLDGLVQSVRDIGPASFVVGGGAIRAFGTFGRPNSFAGFLEFGPFLGVALGIWFAGQLRVSLGAHKARRQTGPMEVRRERWGMVSDGLLAAFFLGCAGLDLVGILASYSRGAWLGIVVGCLVFAISFGPRTRLATLALAPALGVVLLGGATGYLPTSVGERVGSIVDEVRPFDASTITINDENFAAVERMAHWQAGWRMFEHHPALGVGIGNFNARYPDYYVREEFRISQGHAHNIYIQMLAETGMLGLFAYLLLFGFFLVLAVQIVVGSSGGLHRHIAVAALATLVSVGVHDIFEDLHVLNISVMFAALWVLVIAAHDTWRRSGTFASGEGTVSVEYSRS